MRVSHAISDIGQNLTLQPRFGTWLPLWRCQMPLGSGSNISTNAFPPTPHVFIAPLPHLSRPMVLLLISPLSLFAVSSVKPHRAPGTQFQVSGL